MKKEMLNNVRLGIFVSSGLLILIVSLYLIGKNQNFFGANFNVKVRFSNINGLVTGNNVRFSGIQAGTVSSIQVINDTTIEVTMLLNKKIKPYIHENTLAAIGNDGLMGNKVINLTPNKIPAPAIAEGGLLVTKRAINTDDMMEILSGTNVNVNVLSSKLMGTVDRINNSAALWQILNDTALPRDLGASMANIRQAAVHINAMTEVLNTITTDIKEGRGTVGELLTDEKVANDARQAIASLNSAAGKSDIVLGRIDTLISMLHQEIAHGNGPVHTILKDTLMVVRLNNSMANIEKGTAAFNQDMEALKHNFLTRGYFRKEARKHKKTGRK